MNGKPIEIIKVKYIIITFFKALYLYFNLIPYD